MKANRCVWVCIALVGSLGRSPSMCAQESKPVAIRGQVVDAVNGSPVAARVYVQGDDGSWYFPASTGGTAIQYRKSRTDNPKSVEMHTTLSAHPFSVQLAPGKYTFIVE